MSMDAIRERIDQTVVNLEEKRKLLQRHKAQYNDLKFKLMDFQQYKETDKPQIDVKLNSKAIVKGQIVNPQKILVFLGCEYFVERDPSRAIKSVESKLKFLNKAIGEFDTKIKDAKKTIENIGHLEEFERKKQSPSSASSSSKNTKQESVIEEVGQDEEFPFMDIREELDEDGNVIRSSVQKQDDSRINGFAEKSPIDENGDIGDYEDQIAELLEDMDIKPRPKIEEIPDDKVKEPQSAHNDDDEEENNEKLSDVNASESIAPPKPESQTKSELPAKPEAKKEEEKEEDKDEFYQLMREMGISTKPKNGKSEPKEELEEPEEPKPSASQLEEPVQPVIEVNGEWGDFDPEQPAIEQDDIMQLQVIADEFEEDGEYDYEYDEDEEDFEFDENDEDEDEDEDWDFSTNPDSLIPDSHRNLFMKELERVRNEKAKTDKPVNNKDEPVEVETGKSETKKKKKKSVSFAPELQIKQIENISEELKNAPDHGKLSKFKQLRLSNTTQPAPFFNEVPSTSDDDIKERPVSDIVVEKDIIEQEVPIVEPSVSDIVEKEEPLESQPVPITKRVSKFKQRSSGNISESFVSSESGTPKINTPIMDTPISEIVEKDFVQEEAPAPTKKDSKFKQRNSNSSASIPVSQPQIMETAAGSLSDIVEKDDTVEVQPSLSQEKVSRFKSSLSKPTTRGNVISIPKNEHECDVENDDYDEFEDIKAYITNDEEDEDALNAVTDMDIYTTAEIDGSDEDDLDGDEIEEDGGVLVDRVVESDAVDDPNYFVDDNMLQKEYQDMRRKMFAKYMEREGPEIKEKIIPRFKEEDEGLELEPIDEHGNPLKMSRFMESLGK